MLDLRNTNVGTSILGVSPHNLPYRPHKQTVREMENTKLGAKVHHDVSLNRDPGNTDCAKKRPLNYNEFIFAAISESELV